VVLDIIENELSYSQAARKYDLFLTSGSLNDTLPARWVYQYRLYGKEPFFQTPKEYRKNPASQFHKLSKEAEAQLELKVKHLEMELEYTKKLIALIQEKVKGYQIARSQNQQLILKTLKKAMDPYEDLSQLLIHSDQGILYQSPKYRNYLKKSNLVQSMSTKGNAYDNAVIESFFGTLKCETIYVQKVRTLSDLIQTIDQYIYWYNHHRKKLTLGGYPPIQFRLMNQKT